MLYADRPGAFKGRPWKKMMMFENPSGTSRKSLSVMEESGNRSDVIHEKERVGGPAGGMQHPGVRENSKDEVGSSIGSILHCE